ncbi:hypothetical protein [Aquitalea pelogenes]|uniref:hypothetical protein n=1 Tax=Aquitalea pelogenes TaxID=1293573 RepID=UPI0035AD8E0D
MSKLKEKIFEYCYFVAYGIVILLFIPAYIFCAVSTLALVIACIPLGIHDYWKNGKLDMQDYAPVSFLGFFAGIVSYVYFIIYAIFNFHSMQSTILNLIS